VRSTTHRHRPSRSHARCGAWPVKARCDEPGDRAESRLGRSRDPRADSPAAVAVAPVRRAAGESHRPTPGLLASRSDSRRSDAPRAAPHPSQIRWRLLPGLARSSVGFGPVWSPPYTARMEQLSTTARDQSIWSLRASQSSSAKWIRSHRPACCQSRTRREHVIPDPPEFLREHLPRDTAAEHKQNAGETRAIGDARPSASRPMGWSWQERFDKIPQRIRKQRRPYTFTLPRRRVSGFGGFVTRSKESA